MHKQSEVNEAEAWKEMYSKWYKGAQMLVPNP
jgi:hypothetical protein